MAKTFPVYNVHSPLHLLADATTYESLDKCSAFQFERYLHQLKKMVGSGNHVLIQVAKRLQERSQIKIHASEERPIHIKHPNNVYIVSPTSCCEVLESANTGKLLCKVLSQLTSYLRKPCDSRIYGAFVCVPSKMELLDKTNVQGRAMLLEDEHGRRVALSVLHDLN